MNQQESPKRPIAKTRQDQVRPRNQPRNQPQGQRPEHPSGAATLLIIGVTLLIFVIAAVSTFSGR